MIKWFKNSKNKDKPEICGYLDKRGKFFKSKYDRDLSDYGIDSITVKHWYDQRIYEYFHRLRDYEQTYSGELLKKVLEKLSKEQLGEIVSMYIEFKQQIEQLRKKI